MSSQHGHHVIPRKVLFKVFGALVLLTILTGITAEYVDLGVFNIPLALAIAGSKAGLVVTFFMALKYDNKVNTLVFMFGAVFAVVFLTFTLFDTAFRGDLGNVGTETISETESREERLREREAGLGTQPAAGDTTAADTTAADPSADADEGAAADTASADTSAANGADVDDADVSREP